MDSYELLCLFFKSLLNFTVFVSKNIYVVHGGMIARKSRMVFMMSPLANVFLKLDNERITHQALQSRMYSLLATGNCFAW